MLEHDELDDEKLDELVLEAIEQLELEELKQEDEVEGIHELINSMEVMEAELTDIEVDDDGDEVMEVSEIVVEMMINEDDEEVDM